MLWMSSEENNPHLQNLQNDDMGRVGDDFKLSRSEKLSKLERMPCFPKVKNMLEQGVSVKEVARFIQEEAKEYLDASRGTVSAAVYHYVQRHTDVLIREQVPLPHIGLQQNSIPDIDALGACNLALATQLDRVMIDYTTEKKIKKTINTNTFSMKVLNDLLKTKSQLERQEFEKARELAKAGVSAKSGIDLDDIPRLKAAYATKYGDKIADVVFSPDSRRRVMNALEKVKRGSSAEFIAIMKKKRRSLGLPEEDAADNIVYVHTPPKSATN